MLEYLIIIGVVVVLLIAFASGGFRTGMNSVLTSGQTFMNGAANQVNTVNLTGGKSC